MVTKIEQVNKAIAESLVKQQEELQRAADRKKARLDEDLKLRDTANRELPDLNKELEALDKELEARAKYREELANKVAQYENAAADDGENGLSKIRLSRSDWQQAQQRADTFLEQKIKQLTRPG